MYVHTVQRGILWDCMYIKTYLDLLSHLPIPYGHFYMCGLNPQLCCYLLKIVSMLSLQSFGLPLNPQGLASTGDLWLASWQLTH